MVEKKEKGEIYAMKSLRKDVLIDYDQVENTKLEKEILLKVSKDLNTGQTSIPCLDGLRFPKLIEDILRDEICVGRGAL